MKYIFERNPDTGEIFRRKYGDYDSPRECINPEINSVPRCEEYVDKALNTIESCKTEEQLKVASVLVENFKEMYKQVGYPKVLSYSLSRALKKQL